jgi:flagellar protein FliO/FliZ
MFGTLFGSEMPLAARFFIAFLVVLALIGLTAWLVRRFGANRLGGGAARGRQPRLAVIDVANVDQRRRLVLIRRDNVEHLLMIGGPSDVVVEPNIVRATGARDGAREPRVAMPNEAPVRQAPAVEGAWPLQPTNEPMPPPRQYRSPASEEPWHAPEPGARPRPADSLTGLAAELSARLNPTDTGGAHPRNEPLQRGVAPPPIESPAQAQSGHNLAEMAQQLEAALRRGPAAEVRPPANDPLTANPTGKAPDMPPRPPREFKSRIEPKLEAKNEPKRESRPEQKPEPKFEPPPTPGKDLYENLEDEMASLLGRPSGKT